MNQLDQRSSAHSYRARRPLLRACSERARRKWARGERGAALIEFALIAPVLFLLIFGIIEFGWAFFQMLDIRHGAREGARLAAVNFKSSSSPSPADQVGEIVDELCDRMDNGDGIFVQITRTSDAVGEPFEVHVTKQLDQLTGFLGFALNGKTISSTVDSRIEQKATWASMGSAEGC
ncbi:MAG: TadE/TadG family type IV pilus assembly protein [Acidimicrobiia bacterium]